VWLSVTVLFGGIAAVTSASWRDGQELTADEPSDAEVVKTALIAGALLALPALRRRAAVFGYATETGSGTAGRRLRRRAAVFGYATYLVSRGLSGCRTGSMRDFTPMTAQRPRASRVACVFPSGP